MLREWANDRYCPEQLPGPKHAGTRRLVGTALNHIEHFWGGPVPLAAVKKPLLKRWLAWLICDPQEAETWQGRLVPPSPQMAVATANKNLAHVLAAVRYAIDEELLPSLPRIRKLKAARKRKKSYRPEQIAAMLRVAAILPGTVGPVAACRFWTALVLLLFDTGARISAAMALRWRDYDAEQMAVLAEADTQKQNADQFVGIRPPTAAALKHLRGDRGAEDLIFPWPLDRSPSQAERKEWKALRRHFVEQVLMPAGLAAVEKPFQYFRRSTATQLAKAGADEAATEQLGHSSPAVTNLYLDFDELGPTRHCDKLPPIVVPERGNQLRLF